jgi:hypothetical protein
VIPQIAPLWQPGSPRPSRLRALGWLMLGVLAWQLLNTALVVLLLAWLVPTNWLFPRPHEFLGLALLSLLAFQIWRWRILSLRLRDTVARVVLLEGATLYTWWVLALLCMSGGQIFWAWILGLGGLVLYLVGYIRLVLALD